MRYIAVFFMLVLTSCTTALLLPSQDLEADSSVFVFDVSGGFDIFYDSGATQSIREHYTSGSVVLNGSYFGKTTAGAYYPAGLWIHDGKEDFPLRNDDPNLSSIIVVQSGGVNIISNNQSKNWIASCLAMTDCRAFQAGPLVLSGNVLQDFGQSWHANEPHTRTLLGKTKVGKVYFFIFTTPKTLTQAAEFIVQDDRFTNDRITLINLDGGPSTAFYDGKNGFRADARFPIVFRIRP